MAAAQEPHHEMGPLPSKYFFRCLVFGETSDTVIRAQPQSLPLLVQRFPALGIVLGCFHGHESTTGSRSWFPEHAFRGFRYHVSGLIVERNGVAFLLVQRGSHRRQTVFLDHVRS